MKRSGILILAAALLMTACNKQQALNTNPDPVSQGGSGTHPTTAAKKSANELADLIKVSANGYLVIPDDAAYAEYLDFLASSTVEEIAAFHSGIGFTSQAGVTGQAGNYIAPSADNGEYIFSQAAMVQIGGILYRGVNSDGYFLAMPVTSLNESTYEKLVAKTFDASTMCKLQVGGNYGEDLEAYVKDHIGTKDETTPPAPPVTCGKKVVYTYSAGGVTIMDESWYFLGFRYRHHITIVDDRP